MNKAAFARALLSSGALKININQPFRLTSGLLSPFYVDCRLVIGDAAARSILADGMAEMIAPLLGSIDVIAGGVTAGVPIATLLADRTQKPLCYIRPEPKAHGAGRQIEGADVAGKKVLLVEDLITKGSSIAKFQTALTDAGAGFTDVAVILSRATPDVLSELKSQGLALHALLTLDELLAVAGLDNETRTAIEAFQNNPAGWSVRRG
ncbi:MAG TPA: orotate phosphoribosyltransferase [Alphaproteobacteria bacterium]|nr:orotate phosphoribosyltransferase [Rhodospirillaceae bacterium]HRJ12831.1 orotate phosphoribosyltransferase [Alphaproteobacteria bacterium]